jgi:hypothetical protein
MCVPKRSMISGYPHSKSLICVRIFSKASIILL